MNKRKLPSAKDWRARDIDDWTTVTFTEYLKAKHLEMFGIPYAPFKGWKTELGMIGSLIGTKSGKPRQASNESVKRFIDEAFASYKPTPQYPTTNFGWLWTYRKTDWQRIQAEELRRQQAEAARQDAPEIEDLNGWW